MVRHVFLECLMVADSFIDQIFGVDIEARARADRKRVPLVVTTLLTFLDNREHAFRQM